MTSPSISINPAFLVSQAQSGASSYSGAVYILAALTFFAPLIEGGTTHFPVFVMRTILFLTCLACMLLWRKDGSMTLESGTASPLILALLMSASVSVIWAPYKHVAVQWVVTLAMYAVFFQLAYQAVRSFAEVRILVMVMLVSGALQAAYGILQFAVLDEYRAHGTFFNPNFFASYQAGMLIMTGSLLSFSGDLEISHGKRAALWGLLILSLVAFLLARSRGASLALVLVMSFIAYTRFGRRAILVLVIGLLAFIVIPNPLKARSLEVASHDHFAYTRMDMWKNAMVRIGEQPWGSGLGMYKYVSFKSRFPIEGELARFGRRPESPHNEYLQIAAELGIAGLLIVLTGAMLWIKEVRKLFADESRSMQRAIMIGLAGIVSAILIHALVDSVFHEPALVLWMSLAAAMVLAMARTLYPDGVEQRQILIRYTGYRALIGTLIAAILLVLTTQPATAWYAFDQGNKAARSGDIEGSLSWYHGATTIEPWNAAYHDALASSDIALFQRSHNRGWILDAVEELKMCSSLNELDGRFPYRLGMLYQLLAETAQGRQEESAPWFVEAADSYRLAVTRDPYFPLSRVALGKLQLHQDELRGARTSFSEALVYEPNYLPARALRIEVDMALGDSGLAIDDYRELLAIHERWKGKATTALEMQFLDVDLDRLKRLVQS